MFVYLVTSYDKESNPDFIADFTLFILWSEIEANVAMIVCCMPTLGPVIGRGRDRVIAALRSTLPSEWSHLSTDRTGTKISNNDIELSRTTKDHSLSTPGHGMPWQGDARSVATAGYLATDSSLNQSSGIVAHTEISRTSEPRPPESWRESLLEDV